MTMMLQVAHNMQQEMTVPVPQPRTLTTEEDALSIEQLFNLYMEANKEVTNAKELLNRTSPLDAFYNDVRAIQETMQLKRDNYQLMIVKHARQSKGSLEYLKKLGAKSETFTTAKSTANYANGDAINANGVKEKSVEAVQENDDIPLAIRRREVASDTGVAEREPSPLPAQPTLSVRPRETSREALRDASPEPTEVNSETNAEGPSRATSSSQSPTPTVGTESTVEEEKPSSSAPPPSTVTDKTTSTVLTQPSSSSTPQENLNLQRIPEITSTTPISTTPLSTTPSSTTSSSSSSTPSSSTPTSTTPTTTVQLAQIDTHLAPLVNTTKTYTSDEADIILKAIGEMKIQVSQAQKFIIAILEQNQDKSVGELIPLLSSLITTPSKEDYGTEKDIRYFIIDQILKMFSSRNDVIDGLAAQKTVMMRVGNWLRWEQRQRNDESSIDCLKFFEALKSTTKQLNDSKVSEVLSRIAKRESSATAVSARAQKIIDEAVAKQILMNPSDKRSFSVSDYVTQTMRKTSATSETTDSGIVEDEVSPVPKEPCAFTGTVKSILRVPNGSSGSKKSVKFKADESLVQVQYFESEQDVVHHTVQEDQKKVRMMDMDEGRLLKGAQEGPNPATGAIEVEILPWSEPPLISFDIGDAFKRHEASVTRGGTMELQLFEDTLPKPTMPIGQPRDSPFEPEGLVTPHLIWQYFDDGHSALVKQSSPTLPNANFGAKEGSNASQIDTYQGNSVESRKRERETDVWRPDYDKTKKPRVDELGPLSRRSRGDETDYNLPQPHRHGFLGAAPPARTRAPLAPQESTTKGRDNHATELNPTIIQWRLNDIRDKVRKGARTLSPKAHTEICAYYPNCRWGADCHYLHLNKGKKDHPPPLKRGPRRR